MIREQMASSLARLPELRITWASPSAKAAYLAGSSPESRQASTANLRRLGKDSPLGTPKSASWASLPEEAFWRIGLIVVISLKLGSGKAERGA